MPQHIRMANAEVESSRLIDFAITSISEELYLTLLGMLRRQIVSVRKAVSRSQDDFKYYIINSKSKA